MALGEYVSVSSQRDSEKADIAKERWELETMPEHELEELTAIFMEKGISPALARDVAEELTAKDALAIHLAEELGITEVSTARPVQAAVSSAVAFTLGSAIPLATAALTSDSTRITGTLITTTAALALLGYSSARYGRASKTKPVIRVVIGGLIAMAITMGVGSLFGAVIA
jgi:VIT1/CCC1 family predicted Fe2+/Mn2+ transporter